MTEVFQRQIPPKAKFADLHFHTSYSHDVHAGMNPQEAAILAERAYLTALAITDHNLIGSAYEAANFASKNNLKIEIVIGEEISTKDGHLIALFIEDQIAPNQSAEETIYQIHRHNGLAIAAHPFCKIPGYRSLDNKTILRIMKSEDPEITLDGIEVFSMGVEDVRSRWITRVERRGMRSARRDKPSTNTEAQNFYRQNSQHLGASIASSDGHRLSVGRASTSYTGDLKTAIAIKQTLAVVLDLKEQFEIVKYARQLLGRERVDSNLPPEVLRILRQLEIEDAEK
jgi:hypothetical protein